MTVGSSQVTVGTGATLLASAPAGTGPGPAGYVLLYPDATTDVFVGGSKVKTTNGLTLKSGGTVAVSIPLFPGDSLYGIVGSGTATVGVLQT